MSRKSFKVAFPFHREKRRTTMKRLILVALAAAVPGMALADYTVQMNAIDEKGVGAPVGTVAITQAAGGGVTFTPNLKGLPPGTHGFHVHDQPNCGAKEQDGKMTPGALAAGHYDPQKTGKHLGPEGSGHQGDLPALVVAADGTAKQPVTAKHLSLNDVGNRALMIHEGGDNYSDEPKPLGGGGKRIACGVIEAKR
jgi:Cu-Zn family superoxide dismutase